RASAGGMHGLCMERTVSFDALAVRCGGAVGVMPQITGKMMHGEVVVPHEHLVHVRALPARAPSREEAHLGIGVPSAVAHPGAAVVGEPVEAVHAVEAIAARLLDGGR